MSNFRNHLSLVKSHFTYNYQWYSSQNKYFNVFYLKSSQPIILLLILAVILTALGIAAGALIPSVSDKICVVVLFWYTNNYKTTTPITRGYLDLVY